MKRLSVRLSILGAVLALGAAVIAHSILSRSDDTKVAAGTKKKASSQKTAGPGPKPIPSADKTDSDPGDTQLPSPATVEFPTPSALRTVSHEDQSPPARASLSDGSALGAEAGPPSNSSGPGSFPVDQGDPASTGADRSDLAPPPPAYGAALGAPTLPVADSSSPPPPDFPARLDQSADAGANTVPVSATLTDTSAEGAAGGELPAPSQFPPDSPGPMAPAGTDTTTGPIREASALSPNAAVYGAPVGPGPETGLKTAETTASSSPSFQPDAGFPGAGAPGAGRAAGPAAGFPLAPGAAAATATAGLLAAQSPPSGAEAASERHSEVIPQTGSPGVFSGPAAAAPSFPQRNPIVPESSTPNRMLADQSPSPPSIDARANTNQVTATPTELSSDRPGDQRLEGQQSPVITLEKIAPDEIQVNRQAQFQVRVRNAGDAPAHNVLVVDRVPRGTQFLDASPEFTRTEQGTVIWQLGTIDPGQEVMLSMQVMPKLPGEIGSVAQATFQAQASVRTICTKPELSVKLTAEDTVLIGQSLVLDIVVTNTGNGAASNVVIEEDVPIGLMHAAGRELEHEIGTLQPQESRRLALTLESTKPGIYENHLVVRGDGELLVRDDRKLQVVTPAMKVSLKGPTLRYLDRQATYTVSVSNPGTAPARNVELVAYLPKGMKYVTSDNQGQYDTQSHAVYWSLEELPATKQGDVHVTILPIEPGSQKLKVDGRADLGIHDAREHEIVVEGLAKLAFTILDVADPIEVGAETAYEIRVRNLGSKADSNIQLVAELPAGLTPTGGDGPTQGSVRGQQVLFAPLPRMAPGEEATFKIHAQGTANGDHVIRAQLKSNELRVPIIKEESTRVYSDQLANGSPADDAPGN